MSRSDARHISIAPDLVESALVEGARANRTTEEQIDHWARLGRAMCAQRDVERNRDAGTDDETSSPADGDTDVCARVQTRMSIDLGAELNAAGMTIVAVDDDGHLVEYRPDGTRIRLSRSCM